MVLNLQIRWARKSPTEFIALAFTDPAGRPLRPARVHRDLQMFLDRNSHALIELPRDHGKSVQMCIRVLWELGRNPALRVKVVCATEALAAERGRFLRAAIADNPRVRWVFPELQPAAQWEATRFTIARPAEALGPSVTCLGVGSGSTGARADLLVCDDIVDVKALRSKADRDRVRTCFRENLVNLLEPAGRIWCLFTPWHNDDVNAELKRNPEFAHFRRAVGPDLEPIWPEQWPRERLAQRRRQIGVAAFSRAYRLICIAETETPIRAEWIRYWTEPAEYETVILAVDPAVSEKAHADASALVVLGRTADNQIHCLQASARRVDAPELVRLIDDVDRQFDPAVILFESNGAFEALRRLLVPTTRFGPKIKAVMQTRDKLSRIHAFSVPVENGSFRLKSVSPLSNGGLGGVAFRVDPSQQDLFDEMTTFPFGEHDDLLDAAAFGTDYLLSQREPRIF